MRKKCSCYCTPVYPSIYDITSLTDYSFPIDFSLNNCSSSGDRYVSPGEDAYITITPEEGYILPDHITVSGANYTYEIDYGNEIGVIIINNPHALVSVSVDCIGAAEDYGLVVELRMPASGEYFLDVTGYTDVSEDLIVNSRYVYDSNVYSVKSIGSRAFQNCTALKSIVLPETLSTISTNAFVGCTGITSITIPDSVTYIGKGAFGGCIALESMTLPFIGEYRKGPTSKNQYPFGYIFGETSYDGGYRAAQQYYANPDTSTLATGYYYIPNTLHSIVITGGNVLYGAFDSCRNLVSIVIPRNTSIIHKNAFYGCTALTAFVIPDTVASIGDGAFFNCKNLTSINIPYGATSIGDFTFWRCWHLASVILPETVISIGAGAFFECMSLVSIVIPGPSISIGSGAFESCTGLKSVSIRNNVISIGEKAFYDCSSLTSIVVPCELANQSAIQPNIGDKAFQGCSSVTSVIIGRDIVSIGSRAFSGCGALESITIPFVGGSKGAVSASASTLFGYIFGDSSYTGGTETEQYYDSSNFATYYIPDTLRSVTVTGGNILYGAFSNCSMLTSVTTPAGVASIETIAFLNCSGLTSITIDSGVTSIGGSAFQGCSGLTSITFAEGSQATSIGSGAFRGCSGVTTITIPDSVTSIGSGVFSGCSSLERITLPFVGNKSGVTPTSNNQYPLGYIFGTSDYSGASQVVQEFIGTYNSDNQSYRVVIYYIPDALNAVVVTGGNILYGSFMQCEHISSVVLPDDLTGIETNAFIGCRGLSSVYLPAGLRTIKNYAFMNCIGLTSVYYNNTTYNWLNTVVKEPDWDYGTGEYVIHCTDGDIYKSTN